MNIPRNLAAFSAFVLVAASASASNVIVNGDFETGDLSGWTQNGTGTTVSNTLPLDGTYSAVQVQGVSSQLFQSFIAITGSVTTSFIFSATDPGGADDRSMNVTWRDGLAVSRNQINLRLVDVDDNGVGDIQVFSGVLGSGGFWQTVLADAVTFNEPTTMSLTINSYGEGANYDLTVGNSSATGITHFHISTTATTSYLERFQELSFVKSSLALGSSVKIDNVSVVSAAPAAPFALTITPNGAHYDFTWNSQTGKTYDLVSSTDLSAAPSTWEVWDSNANIEGTGAPITRTNVPGEGLKRFFSVLEK